jgi:hypothetical protein
MFNQALHHEGMWEEWLYRSTFPCYWHELEVSGRLHASAALPIGERAPDTHWIGGWVGPEASLDDILGTLNMDY